MDIRKLQRAIVDGLEDVKAQNIVVFNTEHLSPLFERVIVASGTSNRQTKALASSVRETVKGRGLPVLSVEGAENGEWIIVDCGAAVAHIMQPAIRDYYRLEEIWGGKAVRMKVDGADARPRGSENAAPLRAARAGSGTVAGQAGKPGARKAKPRRTEPSKTESRAPRGGKLAQQPAGSARRKPAPARKTGARSR